MGDRPAARLLRALVGDPHFTIVSNNCWGAHVYQALGLDYKTPFIGLFIPPESYLRLIDGFDELIAADFTFVSQSRSKTVNEWREREALTYPIGLLGGAVEVNFQHYASEDAAASAWRRRVGRIAADPSRRFFKFDDREGALPEQVREFCRLPLANKVCFTARDYDGLTVVVRPESGGDQTMDGVMLARASRRHFNTLRWISTLPSWIPVPSLV